MTDTIPLEISVAEAYSRRKSEESVLFLDVREPAELILSTIKPDLHIPLAHLNEKWTSIPPDQSIIVYCHHGMRSLSATHFLREKGINQAQSMSGGIEEWSNQIDSEVPKY